MANFYSILSGIVPWIIPWTEEPGRLQSMVLQRVGCDRATKHAQTCMLLRHTVGGKTKQRDVETGNVWECILGPEQERPD